MDEYDYDYIGHANEIFKRLAWRPDHPAADSLADVLERAVERQVFADDPATHADWIEEHYYLPRALCDALGYVLAYQSPPGDVCDAARSAYATNVDATTEREMREVRP